MRALDPIRSDPIRSGLTRLGSISVFYLVESHRGPLGADDLGSVPRWERGAAVGAGPQVASPAAASERDGGAEAADAAAAEEEEEDAEGGGL